MKKTSTSIGKFCLYIVFFACLCFCPYSLVLAEHGPLIEVLRTSHANTSSTNEYCSADTKRERYLASMKKCHGIRSARTKRKVVALTFDDGPSKYTNEVLEVLQENDIKATFFFIGRNIKEYPNTVKKAYLDGHIIGNHTYSHRYLPKQSGDSIEYELTRTNKLVCNIIGVSPLLFRPPYGSCSNTSRIVAENLGFKTILWSAISDDFHYKITTPLKIAIEIMRLIHNGAIICMHDGGGNRKKTVEALKIIIPVLKNEGFEFLTIPELLDIPAYSCPLSEEMDE